MFLKSRSDGWSCLTLALPDTEAERKPNVNFAKYGKTNENWTLSPGDPTGPRGNPGEFRETQGKPWEPQGKPWEPQGNPWGPWGTTGDLRGSLRTLGNPAFNKSMKKNIR